MSLKNVFDEIVKIILLALNPRICLFFQCDKMENTHKALLLSTEVWYVSADT